MKSSRTLLVTVAGLSTRFRATAGSEVLKCLYHEGDIKESLLWFQAKTARDQAFDRIVWVGGYQFAALEAALRAPAFAALLAGIRCDCVFNPEYEKLGSGYSLQLGLAAILGAGAGLAGGEILFMEGDLVVDRPTLGRVLARPGDVFTVSREPITAHRSVVVYEALDRKLRFVYDTAHGSLSIPEPFRAVHNSGQVWKFSDLPRLATVLQALPEAARAGTNLVLVERYFRGAPDPVAETFAQWYNCNTLADYRAALAVLRAQEGACEP